MKRAALFDLDGVLIDTEGIYTTFWAGIDRLYPTGIDNFAAAIKGTTLAEILSHFDSEQQRSDITRRIHDFAQTMVYELMDHVDTFIATLKQAGWLMAIYTSSDNVKMSHLRRQQPALLEAMDAIVTGSDVTHSKPHPEGYLTAASRLGVDIADCVVFEDSFQGLEAGRRSGAFVVGLATTNPAASLAAMADIVVGSLDQLTIEDLNFKYSI